MLTEIFGNLFFRGLCRLMGTKNDIANSCPCFLNTTHSFKAVLLASLKFYQLQRGVLQFRRG